MASERDRESAYKLVGKNLRDDANGVPQMAYVGVIVTQSPRPESAQEVCDQLVSAANHIDKMRLGSTDDCGFSPFSSLTTAIRTTRAMWRSRKSRTA